ncbi:hypothetical protein TrLO_g12245 [Triparma laevis f. longispina]|uniref:Uncharacterized protein n=1 Tax=Triparma laevis f. longispina TaxID=1714387 RepID=A0A9W7FGA7_9STRA|nr:hypothetical protein TrLO_g12245 [Triparma laevis f. longispina]
MSSLSTSVKQITVSVLKPSGAPIIPSYDLPSPTHIGNSNPAHVVYNNNGVNVLSRKEKVPINRRKVRKHETIKGTASLVRLNIVLVWSDDCDV